MPDPKVEPFTPRPIESLACDICNCFGAAEFGERLICPECYGQNCGSCCPEFGREEE